LEDADMPENDIKTVLRTGSGSGLYWSFSGWGLMSIFFEQGDSSPRFHKSGSFLTSWATTYCWRKTSLPELNFHSQTWNRSQHT